MGKKGSWFTALKKAFTSSPKEKPTNVHHLVAQYPSSHGHAREKKRWGGFGRPRPHAEPASPAAGALINIPLYREPSSIEKILGDAEMDQQRQYYAATRAQYQITPARPTTTAVAASAASAAAPLPQPVATARERERERSREDKPAAVVLPLPPPSPPPLIRRFDHDREQQQKLQQQSRAETEWRQQQPWRHRAARQRAAPPDRARAAAVAIQAAFRGYMASPFHFLVCRSHASPRSNLICVVRQWWWLQARRNYRSLRGLIRLQGVMRGASVRRQTAQTMRCMQTLVRVQAQVRASRVEAMERRNRQHHGAMLRDGGRWRTGSQDGGMWDDSRLTPEEADARTKRKVEAVIKRERALAYAYSHQLLKATPMAAHAILADLQSGRSPWWWTPIERHHEPESAAYHPFEPARKPRPALAIAHREMTTPMAMTAATTPARSVVSAYSKPRATRPSKGAAPPPLSHAGSMSIRDDESLTSCPAFGGVPNYMTPTLSASAKARARAQLLQRQQQQQQKAAQEKPRFSFGLGQSIGSWAKSPFWKAGGGGGQPSSRVGTPAASVAGGGRHRSTRSISGLSVDSTVSMPAGLGRRPFK
ncbi:Protein IQ-DOMAIN 14 [Dichanthelium oligosanthes]|uniref:Protein IQ-DOMAIN 14 n=1 Tax=Dichanthelium oligosanthes TaxID=888268 RepID=A0A1E5V7T7_9POAL|nr:Protein IQ-DOMAIN 14 [Dichanthelium oligosanthes]